MNVNNRNLPVFDNHYGHATLIGDWKDRRDLISMQVAINAAEKPNGRCASVARYATEADGQGSEQAKFSPGSCHPVRPLSTMTLIMANASTPVELSDKIHQWASDGRSTLKNDFTHTQCEDGNGRGLPNIIPTHLPRSLNRELIFGADADTVAVFEGQPTSTEYGFHLPNSTPDGESVPVDTNVEASSNSVQCRHPCAQRTKTLYDTYQKQQEKEASGSRSTIHLRRDNGASGADNSSPRYLSDVAQPLIPYAGKEQSGRMPNLSVSKTDSLDNVGVSKSSEEICNSEFAMSEKRRERSIIATTCPLRERTKRILHHSSAATNQSTRFMTQKMSSERIVADSYFQRTLPPPSFPS